MYTAKYALFIVVAFAACGEAFDESTDLYDEETLSDQISPDSPFVEEDGLGIEEVESPLTVATDFRIGMQLADNGTSLPGDWEYTSSFEAGTTESLWVCDGNCYQPDYARLDLDTYTGDNVMHTDFRICMRAANSGYHHPGPGPWGCTDWVSNGSSSTGFVTDSNGYAPGSYKLKIETRPWPTNHVDQRTDFRLSMRAWDAQEHGTWSSPTPWASSGGGRTTWVSDKNGYQPDGFEIRIEVTETSIWSFCSPTNRCQPGVGDCDTDNDCHMVRGAIST